MASILDLFPGAAAERERVRALSQQDLQGQLGAFADQSANALIPFYGAGQAASQGDYGTAAAMGGMDAAGFMLPVAFRRGIAGMFQPKPEPAPAPRRAPPQPQQRPIDEVAREREMGDYQGSRTNAQAEWQSRYSQAAMDAAQGNMTPDAVFFSQRMPDQFAAQVRRATGATNPAMQADDRATVLEGTVPSDDRLVDELLSQTTKPAPGPARKPPRNNSAPKAPRITNERKDDVLRALSQNPDAQLTGSELKYQQFLEPQARAFGEGDVGQGYRIMQTVRDSGARKRPFVEAGLAGGIGTAAAVSDEDFLAEMRAYLDEFGQ